MSINPVDASPCLCSPGYIESVNSFSICNGWAWYYSICILYISTRLSDDSVTLDEWSHRTQCKQMLICVRSNQQVHNIGCRLNCWSETVRSFQYLVEQLFLEPFYEGSMHCTARRVDNSAIVTNGLSQVAWQVAGSGENLTCVANTMLWASKYLCTVMLCNGCGIF